MQAQDFKPSMRCLLFIFLGLLVAVWTDAAYAQRAFTRRFPPAAATPLSAKGDIVLIGNSLTTCSTAATATNGTQCDAAHNGGTTTVAPTNNNFTIVHIDIDADATTFNSSSANLNLPVGSTVLFAGLYWGGDSPNTVTTRNQMLFRAPTAAAYSTIAATQFDAIGNDYQGFADVTAQVAAAGNGTYFGANVQARTNDATRDSYAGWTLVVAYQNASLTATRNLAVYDGYQAVSSTNPSVDVSLSGFLTPPSGPVTNRIGTVAYDGDRLSTESAAGGLQFGPNTGSLSAVTNNINPVSDYFNSTISQDTGINTSVNVTSRNPAYSNTLGFDIDRAQANTPLPNGASTAVVRVTSTSEAIFLGVVTLATDVFVPDIKSTLVKSSVDVNGGALVPGDELEYTISFTNTGNDNALQAVVTDNIPANTTFVAGSLSIVASPGVGVTGSKTDASGDDQAEYIASGTPRVVFRVGAGANATTGGTLTNGQSVTVRFRVRVNAATQGDTVINNTAQVAFVSQTLGTSFTDLSDADASTPGDQPTTNVVASPDMTLTKTHTGNFSRGGTGSYTITATNNGTAPTFGTVTVTDTLPAALTATAISGTGWTCTLATLVCTRSDVLAAGASYPPITLTVSISQTAAASVTNNVAVTNAAEGATRTGNNNAADPTTVVSIADIRIAKTNSTDAVVAGGTVTYTITLENLGPSAADGTVLTDPAVTGLSATNITCTSASGGAACPAAASVTLTALQGAGITIATLPSGGSVTFTLAANVTASGQP